MITEKIDRITKVEQFSAVLPAPKSVKIELTSVCNYRCGFCAHNLRLKERGDMDRALYSRVIREMRDAGVEELGVFYIGESFTCKWLPDAIREAKEVGFPYVFLTTNGSLCTEDALKAVMDAGLDSLKFSMNYADEEQFKRIANVSPRFFRKGIEAVKVAKRVRDEGGYKCGLYASSIAYDGEQQKVMERVVDELRPYVDQHYWLPLYSMGSLADKREKELGYRPTAGNQGRLENLRDPLPCWSAFTEGHVTHTGKLSACCFDAGDKWTMGDLTQQTFMEAWNSEEFIKLRQAHLNKDVTGTVCEQCVAY